MKFIERILLLSVLATLGAVCFKLISTPGSKGPLLRAQERPTPSTSVVEENNKIDMDFSVEGQELIVFRYRGKNSDEGRVQSYLMMFPSGHMGYWYHDGKGAYLYNDDSNIWMYANFSRKEKALVNTKYASLQKSDTTFNKSYNKEGCKSVTIRDLNWGSYFDLCSMGLDEAISKFGDKKVEEFRTKYLNDKSARPFIKFFGLSNFFEKAPILTHRWHYTSTKSFRRNLDLVSIKYYKSLDHVRKNLGLVVPLFNLMERSKTLPVCKAFQC